MSAWLAIAGCFAYLLVLAAWSAPGPAGEDAPPRQEQDVKAAFLYKFPDYVECEMRSRS